MANVAIFKQNQSPQYLESVNTPDYVSDPDAIVNPDISGVTAVPVKFWKRSGNSIVEMTAGEKQAIADAELLARKARADNYEIDMKTAITALVKVVNIRLNASQKITKQEMIDALKGEIL